MKRLILIGVVILVLFASGCETLKGCTEEARICPDGSTVGRNPNNNCEFDPCPEAKCVEEGESFIDAPEGSPYYTGGEVVTVCCEGLEKIHTYDHYQGKCILNKGPRYICIRCGDGICGVGENNCNCPEDCQ